VTDNGERTVLNDRYEIQKRIGRGGMADVFLARDLLLDRLVAIKVLFPEFATDPNFVERFRREAQSAANLTHPNIVAVYDWGKYTNTYFMAMEYVQGRTLADILRANGHVNSVQAAEIANEVAAALGSAHASGVVHRDIKPANILIGSTGQVKVADFGIARAMNAASENNLTQVGSVMGTATYFSPEQAQGGQPDPRSDLYSLGIVLYEMVAGKPPFTGENPVSIAYKQVHDLPQPLNQLVADVPKPFEAIVAKLLSKDPNLRYANADALRDDLRRYRSGEPVMALASVMAAMPPVMPRTGDTGAAANVTRAMPRTTANPAQGATTVMARTTTTPQQYRPPRRNNWYGIAGFIALLALVAGGIVLFNTLKKDDKGAAFALADYTNQPLDVVVKALTDLGLTVKDNAPIAEPSADHPEGSVTHTDPVAGTTVTKGAAIAVFFNPAVELKPIPNVQGKTIEEATALLTTAGFTVVAANTQSVVSQQPPGTVISTNPPFGATAKQGTEVILTVSTTPNTVSVPEVLGLTLDAAKALLSGPDLGFAVTVQTEPSADVAVDTAIRTDPAVNTPVSKGASVTLIMSAGPAKVRVPPLEGQTEAAARNSLVKANLLADVRTELLAVGSPNDGLVISQSVEAGTQVLPGTTIRLKVGKAVAAPTTTTPPPPPSTTQPPATNPPTADLKITNSVSPTTASAGASVTYTIVVSNSGPSPVSGARVTTDATANGVNTVTWSCSNPSGGASCPASGTGSDDINNTVTLPVGGSVTFTVRGTVSSSAAGTTITNTARVAVPAGVSESASANNAAGADVTVAP
jgi:eukaryotic-like serine/threonine-protein kinase